MTAFSCALTVLTLSASFLFQLSAAARRIDNRDNYDEYKQYLQNYVDHFLKEYAPSSIIDEGAALIVKFPDEEIFEIETSFGQLGRHGMMNMASGSKYIAGIVILKCINDNEGLTLDSTVGEILGWDDSPIKDITLDMLGAQVSGLTGDVAICSMVPYLDTEDCINGWRHNPVKAPAGKQFEYKAFGEGFQIANAMCEEASGKRFKDYFDELKAILGIENENMRFGCPRCPTWMIRQGMYDNNPNLGAGLDANADGYSKFMQLLLRKGDWNGQQVISQELVERMTQNPYWPGILDYMKPCFPENAPCPASSGGGDGTVGQPWNYGFFSQLWCDENEEVNMDPHSPLVTQCPNIGHGGAWGAYNWFDGKRGYAASLLMESDITQSQAAMGVGSSLARSVMDMMDWVLEEEPEHDGPTPQEMPEEFDFTTLKSTQPCKEHTDCGYAECTHAGYTVPHFCHGETEDTKLCMSMYTDFDRCAEWRNPMVNAVKFKDLKDGYFCSKGFAVMICPAKPNTEEVIRRLLSGEV